MAAGALAMLWGALIDVPAAAIATRWGEPVVGDVTNLTSSVDRRGIERVTFTVSYTRFDGSHATYRRGTYELGKYELGESVTLLCWPHWRHAVATPDLSSRASAFRWALGLTLSSAVISAASIDVAGHSLNWW
jgi:hypothetical protein